jgi:hypothetical protein
MLHRFARTAAIYSVLVVPPVAGLLAILHLGADLRPPRSIGGAWLISDPAPACRPFGFGGNAVTLSISQSGVRAVGTLSDASHAVLSLELDGDTIAGAQGRANGCHVSIEARLASSGSNRGLVGVLRWPGCTGCSDQAFHASRALPTGGTR